jgi:hypothetical protein
MGYVQQTENLEFQKLLLDAGADPTVGIEGIDTPFDVELRCNSDGSVVILLSHSFSAI